MGGRAYRLPITEDMKDINERLDRIEGWINGLIFLIIWIVVVIGLIILSSCQTTSYIDSEIEQDKEVYLAGGGWEQVNDSTWRRIK